MASKTSIGIRRDEAMARIAAASAGLAAALEIELKEVPVRGRDPFLLQAQTLEAFADSLEAIEARGSEQGTLFREEIRNLTNWVDELKASRSAIEQSVFGLKSLKELQAYQGALEAEIQIRERPTPEPDFAGAHDEDDPPEDGPEE